MQRTPMHTSSLPLLPITFQRFPTLAAAPPPPRSINGLNQWPHSTTWGGVGRLNDSTNGRILFIGETLTRPLCLVLSASYSYSLLGVWLWANRHRNQPCHDLIIAILAMRVVRVGRVHANRPQPLVRKRLQGEETRGDRDATET